MRLRAGLIAAALTALGGIPRILLASGALPDALRPFAWSDPLFVYERGLSGHRLPYADSPFEYPPLVGGISAVLSLAANGPVFFVAAWVIVVAVAAGVSAALLATDRGWRSWALAPQLFLLGTVNFDLLPAALVTAAAVAARRDRDRSAAFGLALGTLAKLYPLALAPLAFLRARARAAFALIFAATLAVVYLPASLQPYSSAGGLSFYAVGIRANLDSVFGLIERLLVGLGFASADTVVVAVTLGGLAATYVFVVLPRARRASDPAVGFALATITVLLWSRLYSPQYSLWALPFFALLGLAPRLYALLAVADAGVFFTIYPLTLVHHDADDPVAAALLAGLVVAVLLRHLALILMWRAVARVGERGAAREDRGGGESEREHERHGP